MSRSVELPDEVYARIEETASARGNTVFRCVTTEWQRMRSLMRRYADTPMDLADASLVAASETLQQRRIFTVDWHFRVYRQQQGAAFDVVP